MSLQPSVTFVWNIENFLYCSLEEQSLNSPAFYVKTLGQSEWCLELHSSNDEVEVLLHNNYCNTCNLIVDYNISFLYQDGSVLWAADDMKDIQIDAGISYTTNSYLPKVSLSVTPGNPIRVQDAITIRCQIWQSRSVSEESLQYFSRTVIAIERRIFHWEVPEFRQLGLNGEKRTYRIIIGSNKPTFSLELFLKGDDANKAMICIDIKQLNECISRLFCNLKISVLNTKGDASIESIDYKTLTPYDTIWSFLWLLKKSEIMKKHHEYLCGDSLNLLFDITYSTNNNYSNIEIVTVLPSWISFPIANVACVSEKNAQSSDSDMSVNDVRDPDSDDCEGSSAIVRESFAHLYNDHISTDFELRSESVPFPVHRNVLVARSPVFNAMFASNMREGECSYMNVPDVSPDILGMLLEFMYTGDVENLDLSSAADLYYAADRYGVDALKQKCYQLLLD